MYREYFGQHEILVPISRIQKSPLIVHADITNGARWLNFGLSIYLHLYFVNGSGKGTFDQAHLSGFIQVGKRKIQGLFKDF